jgi:hypothetical protein
MTFRSNGSSGGLIGYNATSPTGISILNAAGNSVNLKVTDAGNILVPNGNVGIGTTSPGANLDIQAGNLFLFHYCWIHFLCFASPKI